jgi:hypothetical protein
VIDSDHGGTVGPKELNQGVIMMHLSIAKYVGAAAATPPKKHIVMELFKDFDEDGSGGLSPIEYEHLMVVLCAQIATRVGFQWGMNLLLVPFVSMCIVSVIHSILRLLLPGFIVSLGFFFYGLYEWFGESYFGSAVTTFMPVAIPAAAIGAALSTFIVPHALDLIDDAAMHIGDKEKEKEE